MLSQILIQIILSLISILFIVYASYKRMPKDKALFILGIYVVLLSSISTYNVDYLISFLVGLLLLSLLIYPYIKRLSNKRLSLLFKIGLVLTNLILLYLIINYFFLEQNIYIIT